MPNETVPAGLSIGRVFRKALPKQLMALFTGLFLWQFLNWQVEEGIWWPETIRVVEWTLTIVFMSLIIPGLNKWIRFALQVIGILYMIDKELNYHYVALSFKSFEKFQTSFFDNTVQVLPVFFFALGAWAAYLLMLWAVKSRMNIFILTFMTVLLLAIRDSFSSVSLWIEVALVLFSGLSMVIVRHFAGLEQRAPGSWRHIAEKPMPMVIPILLLILTVMTAGIYAPSVKPLLTDPYTAWKHSRGESVATFTGKDGVPIASGPATSGYGRDDSKLGGGFDFDYSLVMSIDTPVKSYWRGETRSIYTGKGWEPTPDEKLVQNSLVVAGEPLINDNNFNTTKAKSQKVTYTVKMENKQNYPVLFAAPRPLSLDSVDDNQSAFNWLAWNPLDSVFLLQPSRSNLYPKTYTVTSEIPLLDEAGLRTVPADTGNAKLTDFLELPNSLPQRVKQLALDVTRDAQTPYDKIKRLELYLSTTYKYNNKPDTSLGQSKDFVDSFLFEIKEGYCDYFSTSLVVLSRSIGMPARWVKGYSTGTSPLDETLPDNVRIQLQNTNTKGVYQVRNADAHSWAEVYFEGWGWVSFEPTPGFTMPIVKENLVKDAVAIPKQGTGTTAVEAVVATSKKWAVITTLSLAAILFISIVAYFQLFRKERLIQLLITLFSRKRGMNINEKIVYDVQRWLSYSKHKGLRRKEQETLRESIGRWQRRNVSLRNDMDLLLAKFEAAKYGPDPLTEDDYIKTKQAITNMKVAMK
jgi:transglutaminase-like putative cysteine protease